MIKAAHVNVLFAEEYFGDQLAQTVKDATGVEVFTFSHITGGDYTAERFEDEMRSNLDTLEAAIKTTITG
jgi:zinc transport system substrate-binding protein